MPDESNDKPKYSEVISDILRQNKIREKDSLNDIIRIEETKNFDVVKPEDEKEMLYKRKIKELNEARLKIYSIDLKVRLHSFEE